MSTVQRCDPLSQALFAKARRQVLGLLFGHPDQSFYLREIAGMTGLSAGHTQRELKELAAAGILLRSRRGQHTFFQADAQCPIYGELRTIITKTIGGAALLSEALAPLQRRISVAFIFGSVARGEERQGSDLDLMVVGRATFAQVANTIRRAEARLGRAINITVYPVAEFRAKLAAGHHFIKTVVNGPKVFVVGSADELGTLLAERVDSPARAVGGRNRPPTGDC